MSLTDQEIKDRVTYHAPTEKAGLAHGIIRDSIKKALETVNYVVPPGREQSVAITKLEEAMFWSNAGIARNHDKL